MLNLSKEKVNKREERTKKHGTSTARKTNAMESTTGVIYRYFYCRAGAVLRGQKGANEGHGES